MVSLILRIICIVVIIAGIYVRITSSGAPKHRHGTTIALAGIVALLLVESVVIIPTGHTGVRHRFGQILDQRVSPGFSYKIPFFEIVEKVNNKQQDASVKDKIWGESAEKTPVYAEGTVITYSVNPERTVWLCANVDNGVKNILTSDLVSSEIKNAMVSLPTDTVTVRSQIEPLAKDFLNQAMANKYGEGAVTIHKITIPNMDFEDSYNEAIAAKSNAAKKQEAEAINNQTNLERAEAEKKEAIIKAEGLAEAARIRAEGEAKVKLIEAEAQLKANQMLTDSLTDKVLENKFYEKWNGQLPQVMGENGVITNIGR